MKGQEEKALSKVEVCKGEERDRPTPLPHTYLSNNIFFISKRDLYERPQGSSKQGGVEGYSYQHFLSSADSTFPYSLLQ